MPAESRFEGLPHSLLHRIFSCGSLLLLDKMRCEQVCTGWRALLRCEQPETSRGVWFDSIAVQLGSDRHDKNVYVRMEPGMQAICTSAQDPWLSDAQASAMEWLAQRSIGFNKVKISLAENTGWQVAFVLLVLQDKSMAFPSGPDLSISTGIAQSRQSASTRV